MAIENIPNNGKYVNKTENAQNAREADRTWTSSSYTYSSQSTDEAFERACAQARSDSENIDRSGGGADGDGGDNQALKDLQEQYNELLNELNNQKPTPLDYVTASLTGLAGVAASCQGFFGDGSGTTTQGVGDAKANVGGGDSPLDKAVADFNAGDIDSAALGEQLTAAKTELSEVNGQISDKKAEVKELEGQLKNTDAAADSIKQDVKDALKEKETAEKNINDCNTNEKNIGDAIAKNKTAQSENASQTADNQSKTTEVKAKINGVEQTISVKTNEKGEAEGELDQLWANHEKLKGEHAGLEQKESEAQATVQQDETDLSGAKQAETQANSAVRTASANVQQKQRDLSKAQGMKSNGKDNSAKQTAINNANQALQQAKAQETQAKERAAKAKQDREAAETKLGKDKQTLADTTNAKEAKFKEMTDNDSKIKVGEQTLADIDNQLKTAKEQKTDADNKLQDCEQQLQGLTDQKVSLTGNENNLNGANNTNAQNKDGNQKNADTITAANLDDLRVNADKAKATLKSKIDAANSDIEALESRKSSLEKSIQEGNKALGYKKNEGIDKNGGKYATPKPTTPNKDDGAGSTPAATTPKPAGDGDSNPLQYKIDATDPNKNKTGDVPDDIPEQYRDKYRAIYGGN